MANYLSEDLRIRVIEAVEAGSSRRGAAARFGVSVSSAIRWVDVWVSVRSGRGMGPVKRISHVEARPHKVLSFCW